MWQLCACVGRQELTSLLHGLEECSGEHVRSVLLVLGRRAAWKDGGLVRQGGAGEDLGEGLLGVEERGVIGEVVLLVFLLHEKRNAGEVGGGGRIDVDAGCRREASDDTGCCHALPAYKLLQWWAVLLVDSSLKRSRSRSD